MQGWKNRFKALRPVRIWQQIFVVLLLFAVVPMIILGVVLIYASQHAVKSSVQRDHRELALRAAGEVNEFVRKPGELLLTVASIIGVNHADPWRQETAIVELALRYPMFHRIVSIDMKGNEVASSRLGSQKEVWGNLPGFLEASQGKVFVSSVQIRGNDTPEVTVAVPVTQWGKTSGVLVAEVNLRGMWDIVDSIQVGKTGYACVLDRSGAVISHPNKKLVLGNDNFLSTFVIERVLSGDPGITASVDRKGAESLIAYAPIGDTGWTLVISRATDDAYSSSRALRIRSWAFVLFSILAAFVASIFLARFISRPINRLLEGTRRIAEKDFDYTLPVEHNDEVGEIFGAFNQMAAQLKEGQRAEKLSLIGKAATSIVHELKNSLILVDTYMQLLGEQYKDRKFVEEFMRVVPQELNAWKGMLQNMVDYARPVGFPMQEVDVNGMVNDIVLIEKIRMQQCSIEFEAVLGEGLPMVLGNVEKLKQVMFNLLSNAMESTSVQGKISVSTSLVRVEARGTFSYVVIRVHNTGEIIPLDKMEKIFEPFFSTKSGNLGLGLAISREIVEHHKGFIKVVSNKAEGTAFHIYLPAMKG